MSVPPVEDLGLLNVSLSFAPPLGVTKFVAIGGLHFGHFVSKFGIQSSHFFHSH
jgi:hypothetical protein